MVFVFFVAVGLDKIRKLLHFSVAAGSYFFRLQFSFHAESQSVFILQLQFSVDSLALCVFKKQFLKSCLTVQCLLFVVAVLGGQC